MNSEHEQETNQRMIQVSNYSMDNNYPISYPGYSNNLMEQQPQQPPPQNLSVLDSSVPNLWSIDTTGSQLSSSQSPYLQTNWSPNPLLVPLTPVPATPNEALLALQQTLMQPEPNFQTQNVSRNNYSSSNPIQINIQPRTSILSSLATPQQTSPLSSPPNGQKITFRSTSPLSSMLMNRPLMANTTTATTTTTPPTIPRTADELSALLKQTDTSSISSPISNQSPISPIDLAMQQIQPTPTPAVDEEYSLIPLPEDRSVGTFGTEVEDLVPSNAALVQPNDPVHLVRDLSVPIVVESSSQNTYKVQVQNANLQPIGYLPTRIVVEIFVSKISPDDWRIFSLTEKGAWHQLSVQVGRPLSDIVPIRSLQPEMEPLLSNASQSLVKAGSNIKSSSTSRSVGSSGSSGGVKRSADTDMSLLDSSSAPKRAKTSNVATPLGNSSPQVVLKFTASSQLQQLAQSSPAAVRQLQQQAQMQQLLQQSQQAQAVQQQQSQQLNFGRDSSQSLPDQAEKQYIDRLLDGLHEDYLRRSQELQNKTTGQQMDEDPLFYPEVEPSSRLTLSLRPYQREGLRWLVARESTASGVGGPQGGFNLPLPPGWTEHSTEAGKRYFVNDETKQSFWTFPYDAWASHYDRQRKRLPVSVCGGILADDMGMGKTIQILSLIVTNTVLGVDSMDEPKKFNPTLIICPPSLLHQWYNEIKAHVQPDVLSVYMYHGSTRKKNADFISKHDIVLTTYTTLASEFQNQTEKSKGPLATVKWFRVVLDEAHIIKDRATLTAKATCNLQALRRWAVTGTPIQNKLAEIFSLFLFLRVEPFGDQEFWTHAIMKPIRNRDERGLERLRSVLSVILLRRTKDQKVEGENGEDQNIVALPPRQVAIRRVEFSENEQKFYDALWSNSKMAFEAMVAQGTALSNYAHVLELLLRVRQACDHPRLVIDHQKKRLEHEDNENETATTGPLRSSRRKSGSTKKSLEMEETGSNASSSAEVPAEEMIECSVCYEGVLASTAYVTKCHHTVCRTCVQDYMLLPEDDMATFEASLSGSGPKNSNSGHCPVCGTPLQFAEDVAPLSLSGMSAKGVTGSDAMDVSVSGPVAGSLPEENAPLENDPEEEAAGKMDLRKSMALVAPGSSAETSGEMRLEHDDKMDVSAPGDSISLRMSNTIGNLRSSNYNPSWTFMAPATNYPSVSETIPDPLENSEKLALDELPKRSIKVQSLLDELLRIRKESPDDKAVVFSQWTSMLDIIEKGLGEEGIAYGRLDGKMTQKAREEAIHQFRTNPNVPVFLISLKAGGLGLNLVVANHVFMMDPWWNPSTEEQAIDRCHRIGQTKPVYVTRFIIAKSIEERILELQEKKRNLARGALGRKSAANLKEMRLEDLRLLFTD